MKTLLEIKQWFMFLCICPQRHDHFAEILSMVTSHDCKFMLALSLPMNPSLTA